MFFLNSVWIFMIIILVYITTAMDTIYVPLYIEEDLHAV